MAQASVDLLEGRFSKCTYPDGAGKYYREGMHKPTPSSTSLPFFEYQGPGSKRATQQCKNCGYYDVAHEPAGPYRADGKLKSKGICDNFEPHGAFEFDSHYCGCWGWD